MKGKKRVTEFSMKDVTNLDPYCVNALDKDLCYLTAFETDRLLAGFRETAGISTKGAKRYEGWESTLIGGHTIGHFLSAIAQAYANPGTIGEDKEIVFQMIQELIQGLLECQANSKGKKNFLFGAVILDPDHVEIQFDNIEKDRTNNMTEAWVPWYTLHKILAGVVDVYKLTDYTPALTLAKQIGDWSYERAMGWDEETAAQVIRVEYGGMNEILYELYALTGDERYAIVAHCFDAEGLFEKIASGAEDALNNLHANTTIPKFIGALNRYLVCHGRTIQGRIVDASKYLEYAKAFWDMVVEKHTYITGGNSEWEHFGKDYILDQERTNCNCETCNIYNMCKLSRTLFEVTKDVKYADYYEKAFINTILSSQNPETGMTTYFQPMSNGYFKTFGQKFDKFWCCTGTGMENFTKLNEGIFYHDENYIYLNLYLNSCLSWEDMGYHISIIADLKKSDKVEILVETEDEKKMEYGIAIRIPSWISGDPEITINQKQIPFQRKEGYIYLEKGISNGSTISAEFPRKIKVCPLPDNPNSIAFQYGPYVLSADLGQEDMRTTTTGVIVTIPAEKVSGYDDLILPDEITKEDLKEYPETYLVKEENTDHLSFRLLINGLTFAPHYTRYKERYGIYFVLRTKEEVEQIQEEKKRIFLEKPGITIIDTVQPGYGQYENDELHRMCDWGGSVGSTERGTSRYAKSGGSFTYFMKVSNAKNHYLSLTFLKEDSGKSIRISSGDEVIFEDILMYSGEEESYEIRIQIPEKVVKKAQTLYANGEKHSVIPLTFKGSEGAQSARLFGFVSMMI